MLEQKDSCLYYIRSSNVKLYSAIIAKRLPKSQLYLVQSLRTFLLLRLKSRLPVCRTYLTCWAACAKLVTIRRKQMPIYEYYCPQCKSKFEQMRSINNCDKDAACPVCGTNSKKAFSRFASFSKNSSGISSPISGTSSSCSGCTSSSCSSCGM